MRFSVKDSNLYPLPGNEKHMVHLATIAYGLREFTAMACYKGKHKGKIYMEEKVYYSKDYSQDVTGGHKFIEDDNLATDLIKFTEDKGLLDMKRTADTLIDSGKSRILI